MGSAWFLGTMHGIPTPHWGHPWAEDLNPLLAQSPQGSPAGQAEVSRAGVSPLHLHAGRGPEESRSQKWIQGLWPEAQPGPA